MEVGVYRFGHRARQPDGTLASTSRSIKELMEGVRLADEVGLDYESQAFTSYAAFHRHLGHSRHILQMDLGPISQREWLTAIELLGTRVAPEVRTATSSR